MTAAIEIPDELWDGADEAVLSRWYYNEGDLVEQGALIAEVMVEKISFEILAPASGRLNIAAPEEAVVRPGAALGRIIAS